MKNNEAEEEKKDRKWIIVLLLFLLYIIVFIIIHNPMGRIGTIGVSMQDTIGVDAIKVYEGNDEWNSEKELNIFKNYAFDGKNMIAPGSYGNYSFVLNNTEDKNATYNMDFSEENPKNVNMMYKLKLNDNYIVGNTEKWVSLEELNLKDLIITGNSNELYTIEWKWVDAENDTEIGRASAIQTEEYKLTISVNATF